MFDTTIPSIAPVTVAAAQAAPVPPAIAEASAKARVREAFAQIPSGHSEPKQTGAKVAAATKVAAMPAGEPNNAELKQPQPKRKVAKARPAGRPVMLVAQQPHFGLFDTTW